MVILKYLELYLDSGVSMLDGAVSDYFWDILWEVWRHINEKPLVEAEAWNVGVFQCTMQNYYSDSANLV